MSNQVRYRQLLLAAFKRGDLAGTSQGKKLYEVSEKMLESAKVSFREAQASSREAAREAQEALEKVKAASQEGVAAAAKAHAASAKEKADVAAVLKQKAHTVKLAIEQDRAKWEASVPGACI